MTNETKVCPFCGEEILATAKKCKHCGEWLNYKDTSTKSDVMHCSFCGKPVSTEAEKCPNCGEWLKDEDVEASCGFGLENRGTKMVFNISIVVAIITFVVCIIITITEEMNVAQMTNSILATLILPVIAFVICFIACYSYFLPTIVAISRNHPQTFPIGLINIWFGETVIGWIVCMIWATSHRQGRHTHW